MMSGLLAAYLVVGIAVVLFVQRLGLRQRALRQRIERLELIGSEVKETDQPPSLAA